jgi:hypothetical protein
MISKITRVILGVLAVLLTGLAFAVIGFIVGSNIFIILGLELNGRQGYEAGGPVGFILGALIGLIGSSARLIRKRAAK